jgi:hypothetical protein
LLVWTRIIIYIFQAVITYIYQRMHRMIFYKSYVSENSYMFRQRSAILRECKQQHINIGGTMSHTLLQYTVFPSYPLIQYPRITAARKKKIIKEIRFIRFKMRAKRERALTWWNPATQTHPVLDLSSFVPVTTLPRRICRHSASSVLAVRISCSVMAMSVFRENLFINKLYHIYVCYTNITLCIAFGIIRGFT